MVFIKGELFEIDIKDERKSRFLSLALSKGFIDRDVMEIYREKGKKVKGLIGEFLKSENLISPHAIEIIYTEQLLIRLSQIFSDRDVAVSFEHNDMQHSKLSESASTLQLSGIHRDVYFVEYNCSSEDSFGVVGEVFFTKN